MTETLSASRIDEAVRIAGLAELSPEVPLKFSAYFDLLQRWNSRLNLTAIRTAEGILERHFLESIFCAQSIPSDVKTLLDFGSGGGFPGVPIALCRPEIQVTLAESQGKKAAFLREVVRELGLAAEVYAGRVESMPAERTFDTVTLRAVDRMPEAICKAELRLKPSGLLILFTTGRPVSGLEERYEVRSLPMMKREFSELMLARKRL